MLTKTKSAIAFVSIATLLLLGACAVSSPGSGPAISVAEQATAQTVQVSGQLSGALATTVATSDTSASGAPPSSAPPGGAGGATAETALASASAVYTLNSETATQADQTYTATQADQSGVYVIGGSNLTLTNPTIAKTGDTSSSDYSSFFGLNAGLLATSSSKVTITGGTVTTTGAGANGIFATGSGTEITVSGTRIEAVGDGAHAAMATAGGTLNLTNVDMTTTDTHSGAVATDRGGGTITMTGGTVTTSGADSPAIYSTGTISITDANLTATGAEAAVVEGSNHINLTNSTLSSSFEGKWGVMLYQSFSGDAEGTEGTFSMTGGSLAYTSSSGPLFYVTNATGNITLKGVKVTAASGTLIEAAANDRWGQSGSNGGTVVFTADGQTLAGDVVADSISSVALTLQNNSALTGAINAKQTAKTANLTLDASSTWTVTADSFVACLTDPDGISGTTITNIIGNGHTVYYDSAACPALAGQTYSLSGGGSLKPAA